MHRTHILGSHDKDGCEHAQAVRTLLHAACGLVTHDLEVRSRLKVLPCPLPCPLLPEDDARCKLIAANAEMWACTGTCMFAIPVKDDCAAYMQA